MSQECVPGKSDVNGLNEMAVLRLLSKKQQPFVRVESAKKRLSRGEQHERVTVTRRRRIVNVKAEIEEAALTNRLSKLQSGATDAGNSFENTKLGDLPKFGRRAREAGFAFCSAGQGSNRGNGEMMDRVMGLIEKIPSTLQAAAQFQQQMAPAALPHPAPTVLPAPQDQAQDEQPPAPAVMAASGPVPVDIQSAYIISQINSKNAEGAAGWLGEQKPILIGTANVLRNKGAPLIVLSEHADVEAVARTVDAVAGLRNPIKVGELMAAVRHDIDHAR
jgi:hypothetical protein